jgi:hypothetical protein
VSRVIRVASGGVIRRLFGLRQTSPVDVEDSYRGVAEVRAVRVWEEFDEGILAWVAFATRAAVVGEFSVIALSGFSSAAIGGRWINQLDMVIPEPGTNTIEVRLVDVALVLNNGGTATPRYVDPRHGTASVPAIPAILTGSQVALVGTAIGRLASTTLLQLPIFPLIQTVGQIPGVSNIIAFASLAANAPITVQMRGRLIRLDD